MVEMSSIRDNKIERYETGVAGLDNLMEGGIPKSDLVVISGDTGSGKTILLMQIIYYMAAVLNKKCLFISIEQIPKKILTQAKSFGWDFQSLIDQGLLHIIALNSQDLYEIQKVNDIKKIIQDGNYEIVGLDSISSYLQAPISSSSILNGIDRGMQPYAFIEMIRSNAIAFFDTMTQLEVTVLCTSQKIEGAPGNSLDTISSFRSDVLLMMESSAVGETSSRTLQIKKMRNTRIDTIQHNFDFTEAGIALTS